MIVVVGVVVLAVLTSAVWYLLWRLYPTANSSIDQSITLTNKGDYSSAYTVLDAAYKRALFTNDKRELLSNLAAAAANENNLPLAVADYRKLNQMWPGQYNVVVNLAGLEARTGDNSGAINDYQTAITMINNGQATEQGGTVAYLNGEISELETGE